MQAKTSNSGNDDDIIFVREEIPSALRSPVMIKQEVEESVLSISSAPDSNSSNDDDIIFVGEAIPPALRSPVRIKQEVEESVLPISSSRSAPDSNSQALVQAHWDAGSRPDAPHSSTLHHHVQTDAKEGPIDNDDDDDADTDEDCIVLNLTNDEEEENSFSDSNHATSHTTELSSYKLDNAESGPNVGYEVTLKKRVNDSPLEKFNKGGLLESDTEEERPCEIKIMQTVSLSKLGSGSLASLAQTQTGNFSEIIDVDTIPSPDQSESFNQSLVAEKPSETGVFIGSLPSEHKSPTLIQLHDARRPVKTEISEMGTVLSEHVGSSVTQLHAAEGRSKVKIERVSMSEQISSFSSFTAHMHAPHQKKIVETASQSGQTGGSFPKPVLAKSLAQLSAEAYYRCGCFDGRCNFRTQMATQFEVHFQEVHSFREVYPCVHCGSLKIQYNDLLRHLDDHLNSQCQSVYFCDCYFNSSSLEEVLKHMDACCQTCSSPICWRCNTKFSSLQDFSGHVMQNLVTVVKCPYCSAKDIERKAISQHIASMHPDRGRMAETQTLLLCKERGMNGWGQQSPSPSGNSKYGPSVCEKIEPISTYHYQEGSVVKESGMNQTSLNCKPGHGKNADNRLEVGTAATDTQVDVIASVTGIKIEPALEEEQLNQREPLTETGDRRSEISDKFEDETQKDGCEEVLASNSSRADAHNDQAKSDNEASSMNQTSLNCKPGQGENIDSRLDIGTVPTDTCAGRTVSMTGIKIELVLKEEQLDPGFVVDTEASVQDSRSGEFKSEQNDTQNFTEGRKEASNQFYQGEGMLITQQSIATDCMTKIIGRNNENQMQNNEEGEKKKTSRRKNSAPEQLHVDADVDVLTQNETGVNGDNRVNDNTRALRERLTETRDRRSEISDKFKDESQKDGCKEVLASNSSRADSLNDQAKGANEASNMNQTSLNCRPGHGGNVDSHLEVGTAHTDTQGDVTAAITGMTGEPASEEEKQSHTGFVIDSEISVQDSRSGESKSKQNDTQNFTEGRKEASNQFYQGEGMLITQQSIATDCGMKIIKTNNENQMQNDEEGEKKKKSRRMNSAPEQLRVEADVDVLTQNETGVNGDGRVNDSTRALREPLTETRDRSEISDKSEDGRQKDGCEEVLAGNSSGVNALNYQASGDDAERTISTELPSWLSQTFKWQDLNKFVDALEVLCCLCGHGSRTVEDHAQHVHAIHPYRFKGFFCDRCSFSSIESDANSTHKCGSLRLRARSGARSLNEDVLTEKAMGCSSSVAKSTHAIAETFASSKKVRRLRQQDKFTCKLCGEIRLSRSHMRRHVYKVHPEVMICPICRKQPGNDRLFYLHFTAVHPDQRSLFEKVRVSNYISKNTLPHTTEHAKRLAELDAIDTSTRSVERTPRSTGEHLKLPCVERTPQRSTGEHLKLPSVIPSSNAEQNQYKSTMLHCKLCTFKGFSKPQLSEHIYTNHKVMMKCPECYMDHTCDKEFYKHLSSVHPEKKDALYLQHNSLSWVLSPDLAAKTEDSRIEETHSGNKRKRIFTSEMAEAEDQPCSPKKKAKLNKPKKKTRATASKWGIISNRLYSHKGRLDSHIHKHLYHEHQEIHCSACTTKVYSAQELKQHLKLKHPENAKELYDKSKSLDWLYLKPKDKEAVGMAYCRLCTHSGKSLSHMYEHLYREHHEVQCTACTIKVNSAQKLKEHLKIKHPKEEKELYNKSKPLNFLLIHTTVNQRRLKLAQKGKGRKGQVSSGPLRLLIKKKSSARKATFGPSPTDLVSPNVLPGKGASPSVCCSTLATTEISTVTTTPGNSVSFTAQVRENFPTATTAGKNSPAKSNTQAVKKTSTASTSSTNFVAATTPATTAERKWLQCPYCRGERKTQTAVEREIRFHIHYKPFLCSYCAFSSSSDSNVQKHTLTRHPGKPIIVGYEKIEKKEERFKILFKKALMLSKSAAKTDNTDSLKRKYKVKAENTRVYTCKHCDNFSIQQGILNHAQCYQRRYQHVRNYHENCCPYCSFRSMDRDAVEAHITDHQLMSAEASGSE